MPRVKPKPINRAFIAKAHAWSSPDVVCELGVLLGSDTRLQQRIKTVGRNIGSLSDKDRRCLAALCESAGVVGTLSAARQSFASLPKKQGRPSKPAVLDASRRLKQVFAARYLGKRAGRIKKGERFINRCLVDAGLVGPGYGGLRYLERAHSQIRAAGRGPLGRADAIELIADNAEKVREDTAKWELPTELSAYALRIEDDADGARVVWRPDAPKKSRESWARVRKSRK